MRTDKCREKIEGAADACNLTDGEVRDVKRAIGISDALSERFAEISAMATDTVLEIGKRSNEAFLDKAIPKLKERAAQKKRVTAKEVKQIFDDVKRDVAEETRIKAELQTPAPELLSSDDRPKNTGAKFNETNDSIEWADFTWNPVTGCKHGCKYCYAEEMANRFFPTKFEPTFYPERLCAPVNSKPAEGATGAARNVFVCSMADLFGDWVPQEWIDAVMKAVAASPEWNYIFLTKNPKRLTTIRFPKNAWVGTTIDTQARMKAAEEAFKNVTATVKFVSVEPMTEEITFSNIALFNWIIIGGRSETSKLPAMQPEWEWVDKVYCAARRAGLKIYFKPNLTVRPKQFPQ